MMASFENENAFYQDASVARIGKFVNHLDLFRRTSNKPGEIVECGVFKGTSLFRWIKLRALLENAYSRKIIAFDVFGDFPEASFEGDRERRDAFIEEAGSSGLSCAELDKILDDQNLNENVELVEGDVIETLPKYVATKPELRISLLNIDVDLYEPTLCCLETLYPHVVPGGIIILDDYGAFAGANQAIDAYLSSCKLDIQKLSYASSVSFVVKPSNDLACGIPLI